MTTLFRSWTDEASVILEREYDIARSRIPPNWWTKCYIANLTPGAAAESVATRYLNGMSHEKRLRFLATRQGRVLTVEEEIAIRRTVRRKGR